MSRTFVFDDGQLWHVELTRLALSNGSALKVGARFWADATPDQLVVGRISPPGQLVSDSQLASALRESLHYLARTATAEA